MRPIKFRAWDKKQKKMGYNICRLHFNDTGVYAVLLWDNTTLFFSEFILMEFTGKCDRKGKEVYEGDISSDGGTIIWIEDDCSFGIEYPGIKTQPLEKTEEWLEIVGNIHNKGVK